MQRASLFERLTTPRTYFNMLIWLWFAFVIYVVFSNIFRRVKERKLYKKMIATPCDATVIDYIEIFEKTNGFASVVFNLLFYSGQASDKMRQSQGYFFIRNSQCVSQEVKEQLKISLMSNGVKVK